MLELFQNVIGVWFFLRHSVVVRIALSFIVHAVIEIIKVQHGSADTVVRAMNVKSLSIGNGV